METEEKANRRSRKRSEWATADESAEIICSPSDGAIVAANQAAKRLLSLSARRLNSLTVFDLLHSERLKATLHEQAGVAVLEKSVTMPALLSQGKHRSAPVQVEVRSGQESWAGKLRLVIKHAAEPAAESDPIASTPPDYKTLLDQAGIGVGFYSRDGRVLYMNEAARSALGDPERDHTGRAVDELFGRRLGKTIRNRIAESIKLRTEQAYEDEVKLPTGQFWFLSTYKTIYDVTGAPTGVQIVSRNISLRKAAEESLSRSQRRLDAIFQHSQDGILFVDDHGLCAEANIAALRILGIAENSFAASKKLAIVRRGSGALVSPAKWEQLLRSGRLEIQLELPTKSRRARIVELRAVARVLPGSHICVLRDMTVLKQKEEELQHSLAFSEGILNSLQANIAVINRTGTIVATNAAWRMFCRENDGGSGDHVGECYFRICRRAIDAGEKTAQTAFRGLKQLINGESDKFELVYPCNSPDKERWFRMAATRLADKSGFVVVSHTEITEQKLALAEALRRQRELELIAETVPAMMAYIDTSGTFRFVNRNCAQALGVSPAELIGMTIEDVLSEANLSLVKPHLHEALSGAAVRFDFDGRLAHDRRHILIVDLVPDRKREGIVQGLYALAFDVSELRQSQRELVQKNIALEEVIKSVQRERERAVRELAERFGDQVRPLIDKLESKKLPSIAQLRESLNTLLENIHRTSAAPDFGTLRSRLSPREIEICELIRKGRSSKEIAEQLHVSVLTVNKHRQRIRGKLHLEGSGVNLTSLLTRDY